jgi:hypothetical protein
MPFFTVPVVALLLYFEAKAYCGAAEGSRAHLDAGALSLGDVV